MSKIVVIRHGQSVWNLENKFTGFKDVELSSNGKKEAKEVGNKLKSLNIDFDYAFTSDLKRSIDTCKIVLKKLNLQNISVIKSKGIRERDYGDLSGKNKDELKEIYGEKQVHLLRRGYNVKPINGESLADVEKRVKDWYEKNILPLIEKRKNILIVGHGNSIRALFLVLGICNSEEIVNIDIPTCKPYLIIYNKDKIVDAHYITPFILKGRQIFDSRGNPTVEVDVLYNNKVLCRNSCPSGAITGTNEAIELRDYDKYFFMGKGVEQCVKNINKINRLFYIDDNFLINQIQSDKKICALDGTEFKENLGGNTVTAFSLSTADAGAKLLDLELFEYIRNTYGLKKDKYFIPTPMVNVLNRGRELKNENISTKLKINQFMIVPIISEKYESRIKTNQSLVYILMNMIHKVYHTFSRILIEKYDQSAVNVGDQGGFVASDYVATKNYGNGLVVETPEEALNLIEYAIIRAGFNIGEDFFIALDCGASEFYDYKTGLYEIEDGKKVNSDQLADYYLDLLKKHSSVKSLEDPFDNYDFKGWSKFNKRVKELNMDLMIIGDDLFTTNIETIKKGIKDEWANGLILKINQIGTITEAVEAANLMFDNGLETVVSHRAGETESTFIIDFAVANGAKYVKIGGLCRGERITKYNRLIQIAEILDTKVF